MNQGGVPQADGIPAGAPMPDVEEIRRRGGFTTAELDHLLADLRPDQSVELDQLLVALVGVRLEPDPIPIIPRKQRRSSLGGGKVSARYLKEVQRYPKMDRETEIRFARRMEFAQLRLDISAGQPTEHAACRAEYGQIRAEFVERNLHLVVSHAYGYRTYGVPLDDLVQEGNAALMRAVEKFDWRHGVRFRTYVAYWIRQAIERFLATVKGAVRVPHHLQQKFRKLKREGKLPRHRDHELTTDQVAGAFEMDRDAARHFLEASRPSFSIDQTVNGEGDTFRDFLIEHWEPEESDRSDQLRLRLHEAMDALDERERLVIALRFGLTGEEPKTLEQIGKALGLSRERSRQIQHEALHKLRESAVESPLVDYL